MYISIFFGILVSLIFFYFVKERNIIIINGDMISKLNNKNIKKDGKCYNVSVEHTQCSL